MKIAKTWEIEDKVSGLRIKIIEGNEFNRLYIEHIGKPILKKRDFWFDKNGRFDGTGSEVAQLRYKINGGR